MRIETGCFWTELREKLSPPAGEYHVVHSISPQQAQRVGLSLKELSHSIYDRGVFAPKDYSVISLSLDGGWVDSGSVTDFFFLTHSKPTDEIDAQRHSAMYGFAMRDPVKPVDTASVPDCVRRAFSNIKEFVVVPSDHLQAFIVWNGYDGRTELEGKIDTIVNVVGKTLDMEDGVDIIAGELSRSPIVLAQKEYLTDIAKGILLNTLTVRRNRRAYLAALRRFSSQPLETEL